MLHDPPVDGRKLTRAEAVVEAIRGRIDGRKLATGARLPSVRSLAETMSVSKSTVVEAYDRMIADGAIIARRGSGFYVAGPTRPLSLAAIGPQLDREIDPLWIMRHSLQSGADMLKPGSGWLPESWMPDVAIQRGLRQMAREAIEHRTQYDAPLGFALLRQQMAVRFGERGVSAAPDQIILTNSASHALDLVCRFLIEPGDAVLVDDPCYFNFHALLRAHRARILGVPMNPDGPDVEAFSRILEEEKPRFYLSIAGLHNPTGATLAPAVAHRLLKLAEKHDTIIVEDEVFADLEPYPATRMASFDGLERVIQVGSLTKTVSAAFRCGFIAAKHEWIEEIDRPEARHRRLVGPALRHVASSQPEPRRLSAPSGSAPGETLRGDGPISAPPRGGRTQALARAARRHVRLGAPAGRTGRGRHRPDRSQARRRLRAGQCLQPSPGTQSLSPLQCRALWASTRFHRA